MRTQSDRARLMELMHHLREQSGRVPRRRDTFTHTHRIMLHRNTGRAHSRDTSRRRLPLLLLRIVRMGILCRPLDGWLVKLDRRSGVGRVGSWALGFGICIYVNVSVCVCMRHAAAVGIVCTKFDSRIAERAL